ncbi:MAG: GNAT family N-acetyltransferase [Rhodospirillaceae bacterium]|nr:GNAT family N-acetyltransferase [Rhodospirillaceae bacterium]
MPLSFALLDKPDLADVKVLGEGLNAHAALAGHPSEWVELAIFGRDEQGRIRAGLAGNTGQGLLYVRLLWVHDGLRQLGLGRKLLAMAEAEAVRRGCHTAGIDTFSFQAPQYYPKLGYREFGRIERLGARRDLTRYWFVKAIS